MLSATIGASTAGLQAAGATHKPAIPEQHFESAKAKPEEATVARDTSAPAVPATNGIPLSVEAVTALQQVDDVTAATEQRGTTAAAVENTDNANLLVRQGEDVDGVAAATAQVEELEAEAVESRSVEQNDVPAGEETDTAGRSVRNPLDLQI